MKLVLLGAPGAGKGTQAEILRRKLNIPRISTGQIMRAGLKHGTPVGSESEILRGKREVDPDDVFTRHRLRASG
jgi:Adenylate kinase and related kinases